MPANILLSIKLQDIKLNIIIQRKRGWPLDLNHNSYITVQKKVHTSLTPPPLFFLKKQKDLN